MTTADAHRPTGFWARPDQYRSAVQGAVLEACASIGFPGEYRVLLLGLAASGEPEGTRLEPAGAPFGPDVFTALPNRVTDLLADNARDDPLHAAVLAHDDRRRELHDRLCQRAIAEALQVSPGGIGWTFFVGQRVRIDALDTHVVVGIDAERLAEAPSLPAGSDGNSLPSLVHALVVEILDRLSIALRAPTDGDQITPIRAPTSEIVRAAVGRFVRAALRSAGGWRGPHIDTLLNAISALPYEGRPSLGPLLLAPHDDSSVDIELRLTEPIDLREKRAVRKLMEASSAETGLVVDDQGQVFGIGRFAPHQRPRGLLVSFVGRGAWDLRHGDRVVVSVRNGQAQLPAPALDVGRLTDLIDRLLPGADGDRLLTLAHAAERHHHGAMLVISSDAAGEAARLSPQSISVQPTTLSPELMAQVTSMDGAILVDRLGRCHAIGVILDGLAAGQGDPARGSRYNNPVRYLNGNPPPAIVIVYSADGGIDLLPELRSRQARERVADAVRRYVRLLTDQPPPLAQIFEAWDVVSSFAFYLSGEQCHNINAATARLESWCAENGRPLLGMLHLEPDPAMNDSYWLP